ncbi:diguanylate cyclase, partial [Escherichia coli]|nr:diguanylate cyclase [Escherichia coli]
LSLIHFIILSLILCCIYTFYIKHRIDTIARITIDSNMLLLNAAEHRRVSYIKALKSNFIEGEDIIKQFKQIYSEDDKSQYFFGATTYILHNENCINLSDSVIDLCQVLKKHIFNRNGFIELGGKRYMYLHSNMSFNMQLLTIIDPEIVKTFSRSFLSTKDSGITVSIYSINNNNKLLGGIGHNNGEVIFQKAKSTTHLNFIPDFLVVVGYSKYKYILTCFLLNVFSMLISAFFYFFQLHLINKVLFKAKQEKNSVFSLSSYTPAVEKIIFSDGERELIKSLYRNSTLDELTKASGRRVFMNNLEALALVNRNAYLCLFDLDRFKIINDLFGHFLGDAVLIKVVSLVKRNMASDYGDIYRLGGDEFAIICYSKKILRETLEKIVNFSIFGLNCTCSIGVTSTFETKNNVERLKALADERLYQSKRNGRAQITWPSD